MHVRKYAALNSWFRECPHNVIPFVWGLIILLYHTLSTPEFPAVPLSRESAGKEVVQLPRLMVAEKQQF